MFVLLHVPLACTLTKKYHLWSPRLRVVAIQKIAVEERGQKIVYSVMPRLQFTRANNLTQVSFFLAKSTRVSFSVSKCTLENINHHIVSEGVDMPLKVMPFEANIDNQLVEDKPMNSSEFMKTFPNDRGTHSSSECHGDNISCLTIQKEINISSNDLVREETPCTSASALCNEIVDLHSDAALSVKNQGCTASKEPPSKAQTTTGDKNGLECNRFSKGVINEDSDKAAQESKTVASKDNSADGSSNEQLEKKIGKSILQDSQPNLRQILEDDISAPEILEDDVSVSTYSIIYSSFLGFPYSLMN